MNLPVKITPDSIRDSIVEIKYQSLIPFEVMVGFIYNALDDNYKYTNRPHTLNRHQQIAMQQVGMEIQIGPQNVFFTESLKLDIRPGSLIFNCLDGYKGWERYQADIQTTLTQISKIKEIEKFTRIGLRYMSEYTETDIGNCTKFNFTFGFPEVRSENYIFRTEFTYSGYRVILSLQHKTTEVFAGKLDDDTIQTKPASLIDIDVIADNLSIDNYADLLTLIEKVHTAEKELFFGIINQEYLQTLNPVYK